MDAIFLDVVNLSLTASWVIMVVLLLLRPVPKKYVCLLWLVVLFRLLCPVTLEAEFSLFSRKLYIQHRRCRLPQSQSTTLPMRQSIPY